MQKCLFYIEATWTGQTYRLQERPLGITNILQDNGTHIYHGWEVLVGV